MLESWDKFYSYLSSDFNSTAVSTYAWDGKEKPLRETAVKSSIFFEVEEKLEKKEKSEIKLRQISRSGFFKSYKELKNFVLYVMKECMSNLHVMVCKHGPQVGILPCDPLMYESLENRFGTTDFERRYNLPGKKYTDAHRLMKETTMLIGVLKETVDEINIFSQSVYLEIFAETHYKMAEEEKELLQQVDMKKRYLVTLKNQIAFLRENGMETLREINEAVAKKYAEWKDLSEHLETTRNYCKNWEESRHDQNKLVLRNKENISKFTIDQSEYKTGQELACHESLIAFYTFMSNMYQDDIERWMDKYDREMEICDLRIFDTKYKIDRIQTEKHNLKDKMEEREEEMTEWLERKKRLREEKVFFVLSNRSARKIQAWWRDVMFRKKLGPYRRKGKKNKKNKKDKEGKNKK